MTYPVDPQFFASNTDPSLDETSIWAAIFNLIEPACPDISNCSSDSGTKIIPSQANAQNLPEEIKKIWKNIFTELESNHPVLGKRPFESIDSDVVVAKQQRLEATPAEATIASDCNNLPPLLFSPLQRVNLGFTSGSKILNKKAHALISHIIELKKNNMEFSEQSCVQQLAYKRKISLKLIRLFSIGEHILLSFDLLKDALDTASTAELETLQQVIISCSIRQSLNSGSSTNRNVPVLPIPLASNSSTLFNSRPPILGTPEKQNGLDQENLKP